MPRARRQAPSIVPRRSQRQSQAGSSSFDLSNDRPDTHGGTQELDQSLLSVSTAPLPPRYDITIALPVNAVLDSDQVRHAYVRGQELLSDGWKRVDEPEGRLVKRRSRWPKQVLLPGDHLVQPASDGGRGKQAGGPLWLTAGLSFPCVCSLRRTEAAYTFARPAPLISSLGRLAIDELSQRVLAVDELPEWPSTRTIKTDALVLEMDSELDVLRDFDLQWLSPPDLSPLSNQPSQISQAETIVETSPSIKARDKGKGKTIEGDFDDPWGLDNLGLRLPAQKVQMNRQDTVLLPVPSDVHVPHPRPRSNRSGWEEEMKRRKQWWRGVIGTDSRYGYMWEFLPSPYAAPARYRPKGQLRAKRQPIPPYKLPRSYPTQAHPFHPDLLAHIKANPRMRVYWLVPIHGPVLVPGLSDNPVYPSSKYQQPCPTAANLVKQDEISAVHHQTTRNFAQGANKSKSPRVIEWTRGLLLTFLETFLRPLYMDDDRPLGSLSYALSGPKPDPFLDLPSAKVLDTHVVPSASVATPSDLATGLSHSRDAKNTTAVELPVRPDCGDHLRIYCDLKHALALRTWLHSVKITAGPTDDEDGTGHQIDEVEGANAVRPLYKTRLTLVGPRGEVLMVA
ncbi:hypothetical protein IAU60_005495 [Kwoniella sp. DSM 27419]